MYSPHENHKLLPLALLWFIGLSLIALSFVKGSTDSSSAFPSTFVVWGLCCILIAVVWMYWDHKRRRLTPDEEVEVLLLEVARHYRRTRSLDAIADAYREAGASEYTLQLIRSAPRLLKTRAEAKISLGMQLLGVGILFTMITFLLSQAMVFAHYELAIGAIGGGIGFIVIGLRQRRGFKD